MLKKAKVIYYLSDTDVTSQNILINHLLKSNLENLEKEKEGLTHLVSYLPPGTILAQSFGVDDNNKILCWFGTVWVLFLY